MCWYKVEIMNKDEMYNGLWVFFSYYRKGGVGKMFFVLIIVYLLVIGGLGGKGIKCCVLVLDYDL